MKAKYVKVASRTITMLSENKKSPELGGRI